jgi:hypothetical protein
MEIEDILFISSLKASGGGVAGLIGEWLFSGNANDTSGFGNNGTVTGATLVNDRFGNQNSAYSFDGNDYITINKTYFKSVDKFTLEYWAYKSNAGATLFGQADAYPYSGTWTGWMPDNNIYFTVRSSLSNHVYVSCNLVNQWVKLKFVYDGSQTNNINRCKIYVNDVLQNAVVIGTISQTTNNGNGIFTIGKLGDDYANGIIDDVRIYNIALT